MHRVHSCGSVTWSNLESWYKWREAQLDLYSLLSTRHGSLATQAELTQENDSPHLLGKLGAGGGNNTWINTTGHLGHFLYINVCCRRFSRPLAFAKQTLCFREEGGNKVLPEMAERSGSEQCHRLLLGLMPTLVFLRCSLELGDPPERPVIFTNAHFPLFKQCVLCNFSSLTLRSASLGLANFTCDAEARSPLQLLHLATRKFQ